MTQKMTVAELQARPAPKNLAEHMERAREAATQQMDAAIRRSFANSVNFNGRLVEHMKKHGNV
jgi:hypothetical protein